MRYCFWEFTILWLNVNLKKIKFTLINPSWLSLCYRVFIVKMLWLVTIKKYFTSRNKIFTESAVPLFRKKVNLFAAENISMSVVLSGYVILTLIWPSVSWVIHHHHNDRHRPSSPTVRPRILLFKPTLCWPVTIMARIQHIRHCTQK